MQYANGRTSRAWPLVDAFSGTISWMKFIL